MKFITFGKPSLYPGELKEITNTLKSGWLGTGPKSYKFEKNFSNYTNSKYSLALNSCTAAIFLTLKHLGLKKGDQVITTPLTFCSTVSSILHVGATPVLADINQETLNIDPQEIEKNITTKTKALIIVHFAGKICDMQSIRKICNKYNLFLIEDCAHAIETKLDNKNAGTFGDFGCFSFYVTKNLSTGEGGMIISKKKKAIQELRTLSLHGMDRDAWKRYGKSGFKHYDIVKAGFKFNMSDIHASIGIHQLNNIEKAWKKRELIWNTYMKAFKNLPVVLPKKIPTNEKHSYHLFSIIVKSNKVREKLLNYLQKNNIGCGVHYKSINKYKFYKNKIINRKKNLIADKIGETILSIPIYESLRKNEIKFIVDKFKKFFE